MLMIFDEARRKDATQAAGRVRTRIETLNAGGRGTMRVLAQSIPATFETVHRSGDDLAALLHTSGTTVRSKGALLTQTAPLSNAQVLMREWRFTSDDILRHALPIFHIHAFLWRRM